MRLQPGTQVDRYVVEGVLGEGGMAEVYAVRHALLGSPAALKVLRIRSPQLAVRLIREGRAQARLQHPNLVPVLDLFEIDGLPALVMERVEGRTLAQLLEEQRRIRQRLSLPRIERLLRGILLGLHEAHRLGIVHRDLKPGNILLDAAQGEIPRIVDFGLATALVDEDDEVTRPGMAIGTPAYMAPEQHEDAHQVDARADVFALGVLMYEMVTGEAPAARLSMVAAWQKMRYKRWKPLSEVVFGLPSRIERATHWALEPERDQRAPSVKALWECWFEEPFPESLPLEASLDRSFRVAPVRAEAAPEDEPSRSSPVIPQVSGPLFGRQRELAALTEALDAQGGVVTVLGTAGVGKTRLAIEAALRWKERDRPVLWVDLQSARDEQELVQQVAWLLHSGVFGISEDANGVRQKRLVGSSGEATPELLARTLARCGPLLLVLDNFEQLPRAAAMAVGQWSALASSLRVLITSQKPLSLPNERTVELLPLPLPDDPAQVAESACWQLFAAAAPQGALQNVPAERMHALMAALDGLPLALELAAARLEILGVEELERRLTDRFALLSDPGASGERHGALYDAIDWSWSLLGPVERSVLAQLSAFVSPFTLEAAEAVIEVQGPLLDTLHGLLRRSLVYRTGPRLALLRSVRDFAARKLEEGGQRRALWRRHARWFGELARTWRAETELGQRYLAEAMAEFLAVLERAVGDLQASTEGDEAMVEDALSCALGRTAVFQVRGPVDGVLRTVELASRLPDPGAISHHRHLELKVRRAFAVRRLGRIEEAKAALRALLELAPSDELRAIVCANLADLEDGHPEQALALYDRAIALAGREHRTLATSCRAARAVALAMLERHDEARQSIAGALALLPPDQLGVAFEVHKARAWVAANQDRFHEALSAYEEVRALAQRRRDPRGVLYATAQLGLLAHALGDLAGAEQMLAEAMAGMREEGDLLFEGYWRAYRGRVLVEMGRAEEGEAEIARTLREVEGLDAELRSALSLAAGLACARTRPQAARAWGEAAGQHPDLRSLPGILADGFVALRAGDRQGMGQAAQQARPMAEQLQDVVLKRMALSLVDELCGQARAWRIAEDGSQVELPDGTPVELSGANARIVLHLARRRQQAPGEVTDACGLAEAGWPGERIVPTAAGNRVRVALSTLRRLGLAELIERQEGGWRLSPEQIVRLG